MVDPHYSDQELLQAIDGELPAPRASEVAAHLSHCWRCRTRRSELEAAIEDFVRFQRETLDPRISPGEGPAARLRATMAQLSPQPVSPNWYALPTAMAALGIAMAVLLIWSPGRQPAAPTRLLPNAKLTPGATRFISREQVCAASVRDDDHTLPAELAGRVFVQYGIRPEPGEYEVDYLINPALGGADDIRNLWPQPYGDGVWTARVKDALEDQLRTMVCDGRLDLATAQQEIATNWIAAYRKYFRTRQPLPAHALFIKDRPWQ